MAKCQAERDQDDGTEEEVPQRTSTAAASKQPSPVIEPQKGVRISGLKTEDGWWVLSRPRHLKECNWVCPHNRHGKVETCPKCQARVKVLKAGGIWGVRMVRVGEHLRPGINGHDVWVTSWERVEERRLSCREMLRIKRGQP